MFAIFGELLVLFAACFAVMFACLLGVGAAEAFMQNVAPSVLPFVKASWTFMMLKIKAGKDRIASWFTWMGSKFSSGLAATRKGFGKILPFGGATSPPIEPTPVEA